MKNRFFLFVMIMLFQFNLYSQFSVPIQPWANEVNKRILVVIIEEENSKEIKKLQKKGENAINNYKNGLYNNNNKLKVLIPKYWPFQNKIEFKNRSEVKSIIKNKDTNYMILDCRWAEEIHQIVNLYSSYTVYTIVLFYPEYGKKVFTKYRLDDNMNNTGFLTRGQYVFKISKPDYCLNDIDMKFVMQQFKEYIERAKKEGWPGKKSTYGFRILNFDKKRISILKEKTLLVPEDMLTIDEDKIKEIYKAPFKVLPKFKIIDLLNNDFKSEYAYYQFVWSDQFSIWTVVIVDNATGSILAENPTTDKSLKYKFEINEEHFLNLMKLFKFYKI